MFFCQEGFRWSLKAPPKGLLFNRMAFKFFSTDISSMKDLYGSEILPFGKFNLNKSPLNFLLPRLMKVFERLSINGISKGSSVN